MGKIYKIIKKLFKIIIKKNFIIKIFFFKKDFNLKNLNFKILF